MLWTHYQFIQIHTQGWFVGPLHLWGSFLPHLATSTLGGLATPITAVDHRPSYSEIQIPYEHRIWHSPRVTGAHCHHVWNLVTALSSTLWVRLSVSKILEVVGVRRIWQLRFAKQFHTYVSRSQSWSWRECSVALESELGACGTVMSKLTVWPFALPEVPDISWLLKILVSVLFF